MITLTVAIPHFAEVSKLQKTLSVLPGDVESLEILVVDNCTPGDIYEAVEPYFSRFHNLRLVRNDRNLGYDLNINRCVSLANGKFIWFIGAGDTIEKPSIERALTLIEENPHTINFVAKVQVNQNQEPNEGQVIELNCTKVTKLNSDKLTPIINLFEPSLSGNIVKKKATKVANLLGSEFPNWQHVNLILSMHCRLEQNRNIISCDGLKVQIDRPQNGWWDIDDRTYFLNVLSFFLLLDFFATRPELAPNVIAPSGKRKFFTILKALFYSASQNRRANLQTDAKVEELLKKQFFYKFAFIVVTKMPPRFLSLCYLSLKKSKNKLFNQNDVIST